MRLELAGTLPEIFSKVRSFFLFSITINTIECVLRLPDSKSKASPESSEASFRSSQDQQRSKKASRRLQQQDTPPGYVQSLINKIISNVKIECNNLILKYVEDDIVLSLNTRWLCLTSANALWEPAFVDLSLPDLVLRKLLQVKDMTICLDRRDISGRINEYQEPFLYRCSLNVHAAWLYDSLTNKIPRVTRYDIRCSKMDFSLTDTIKSNIVNLLAIGQPLDHGMIAFGDPLTGIIKKNKYGYKNV